MNFAKNILAAIGVVITAVLILYGATAGATAYAGKVKQAFDREQAAQDALIKEHKAFISGNKKYFDDEGY